MIMKKTVLLLTLVIFLCSCVNIKFTVAGTATIDASALQCPNIEKHVEGVGVIK